jgi:SSS family solute:Na+ symporter
VLQNRQGFNASALTPHESRMGGVLGQWRMYARSLMLLVVGVSAITFLRHPQFSHAAAPAMDTIHSIPDAYIQKQMTVPVVLRYLLPTGIKGLFCAIMIMGLLAGDAAHMHSWGSIFVQDIMLPLRKVPMSPTQHIWALRIAMAAVAAFAFCFSTIFTQTQYILLWWAITGGMFTGGAGAAIVGGLYSRIGTTAAAWAAAITGSSLALIGIILNSPMWNAYIIPMAQPVGLALPPHFWLNNQKTAFIAVLTAAAVYVAVSYLTCRQKFDLDKMLHRGAYAPPGVRGSRAISVRDRFKLANLLRFDQNFSRGDKFVTAGIFIWSILLLTLNVVVTTWNLMAHRWPTEWWAHYWLITGLIVPSIIALATLIWFGIGGFHDIRLFFQTLRSAKRDVTDDGTVGVTAPHQTEPPAARPPTAVPEGMHPSEPA